jgi:DNA-binding response OmpR family regulator
MESSILVIEEDFDLGKLFDHLLRIDGYEITLVHNWQMAQAALALSQPDLIVFDWALTNTDGYLWIDELRATPKTAHIPILFVCGDPLPRGVTRLLDKAGIPVVEKPFDIFEFRDYVVTMLTPRERSAGVV